MKSPRSQMDIMGLVIIVILISLSFLFILKFNILKKPSQAHQEFTEIELASNFLNTLLKTTSPDCHGLSFTEIYQDCGKGPTLLCENSQDSCLYIEQKTAYLLNKTLDVLNINYEFNAYVNPSDPKVSFGSCVGEKKAKFFPLPLGTSTMFLRLDIC